MHFAVLDDGTKIDAPRFLRRAEKKLEKAQQSLCRKEKRSKNRAKAPLKVARRSSARTKRSWWRIWRSADSCAPGWPRACTTRAGRCS
ncbi:hypothetical protein ABZZ80_19775 [Streptomyces sp. NPDC006356]